MIDVTGIDLVEFAKKVYELSVPQGMGFLHFNPAPLTDEEAKELVGNFENDRMFALNMDYVKGRACKMHIRRDGDKLTISDTWYDHTDRIYQQLLGYFKVKKPEEKEHGCACNCMDCQSTRTIEVPK
jgi:hypothetical protein